MEFIEKTIGEVLSDVAKNFPDRTAVKYTDRDYCRTWKEFNEEAELIGRGLMALGVKKGDHVAIWAGNTPEWMLTLFASAKIGAVLVTVNTNYRIFELEYLLRQSDTKLLVMMGGLKDNNYVNTVRELIPSLGKYDGEIKDENLPCLKRIVFTGNITPEGMLNFEDLKVLGQDFPKEIFDDNAKTLDPHDTINMQYTSGTTGFPKGVMLTHFNILNNGKTIGDGMSFTERDKLASSFRFSTASVWCLR
jgi:Acyl-CoA synthetases (AMP-forming)/AMP-acid ligases II